MAQHVGVRFEGRLFGCRCFRKHYCQTFSILKRLRFPGSRVTWAQVESSYIMKAKIVITPKKAVVDPQGKAVQNALEHMGYQGIAGVHVGKYLEIEITGEREEVRRQIDEACHKLLSNPVIEDYHFELE